MIPDGLKNKPPSDWGPSITARGPSDQGIFIKQKTGIPEEEKADDNDPVVSIERPEPDETEPENNSREEESDHLSGDYDTPSLNRRNRFVKSRTPK